MTNIDIRYTSQENLLTYYMGYFIDELTTRSSSIFSSSLKPCALVYVVRQGDSWMTKEFKPQVYSGQYGTLAIICLEVKDGKVQKSIEDVYERYTVLGLFNLTQSYVVGQIIWDSVAREGIVLDTQQTVLKNLHQKTMEQSCRWAYSFMTGNKNLIPPIMPPSIQVKNKFVLKAYAMCITGAETIETQVQVGHGQVVDAQVTLTNSMSGKNKTKLKATHADAKKSYLLSISQLESLAGKPLNQIDFDNLV